MFRRILIAGFLTDLGGVTSHTAIVARSLGLPAIVGLHRARSMIREGELLIVDGAAGVLIVNPDRQVLAEYQLRRTQFDLERQKLKRLRTTPAATIEGVPIELAANIELPEDVEQALESGAMGVVLFRSEFLFMGRMELPEEDEQFEAYRQVVQAMAGRPVTIRTLDLGADKTVNGADRAGPNPALGLRAIRFCLAEPQMFLTQLRAILRASHYGRVRLLVPMIAHAHEVDQVLHYVQQAKAGLAREGVPFDAALPVGGMIEIPAAALALGAFVKRLDFLSIVAVIATGEIANEVLKALKLLELEKIFPFAYQMHTVKPLDASTLNVLAKEVHTIVIVEEHVPNGGLWAALSIWLASAEIMPRLIRLGPLDSFALCNLRQEELRRRLKFDANAIANTCRLLWKKK